MMKKAAVILTANFLMLAATTFAAAVGPRFDADHAEVRYGSVIIDGIHGVGIGVGVDSLPLDGEIDFLIVLQTYGLIPAELPITIPDARVLVKKNGAVIADNYDAITVSLFLGEDLTEIEKGDMVRGFASPDRSRAKKIRYDGFGFSSVHGDLGDFPSIQLALADPDSGNPFASKAGEECQAGGIGATSCSLSCTGNSSCSVSCSEGTYACCFCKEVGEFSIIARCLCKPSAGGGGGGGGGGGDGDDGCTNDGSGCAAACSSCRPDY